MKRRVNNDRSNQEENANPPATTSITNGTGAGVNPPNQRTEVWQGTVEWQEKKTDNNSRVIHHVTCKMTSLVVNGEPEVKADHWATTLMMQLIPKKILGFISNTFFKNGKSMLFLPDQSHALEILNNSLRRGMAGCVHVAYPTPHRSPHQNDISVIILLYSIEKKTYVGFVPNNQRSFINEFKTAVQNYKTQTTNPDLQPVKASAVADSHLEREVNCPICFERFDEDHAPRTLRCGHSVCTPCLKAILARATRDRNCPECRRPLKVTTVAHIPISYTMLKLSHALELTSAAAAAAEAKVVDTSDGILVGETCLCHHYPIQWWCPGCKEFQCPTCPHEDDKCPKRLPAKDAIIHLKEAQVEETERTVLALNKLKNSLETQRDKTRLALDHIGETVNQLETKIKKVHQQVLDVEEAEALVVEASSARRMKHALARAKEIQDAAQVWLEHKDSRPASPVMSPDDDPVCMMDLYQRAHFTKEMYAVMEGRDGIRRYGRVTLEVDNLVVHSSDTKPPPATALLLDDRTLCYAAGTQMTVFFDIHVEGRCEGRVTVVLFKTTAKKVLFFLNTCKNKNGQTYKGLRVHTVNYSSGNSCSKVFQVGRELKECKENAPSPESDNYFHRSVFPGLVSGLTPSYTPECENSTFPSLSSFVVHPYSLKSENDPRGFAKVLSGLGVLRYAMWEKRDVVIGDCGLVIPFVQY